jgi:Filamin/ABP280 repeat
MVEQSIICRTKQENKLSVRLSMVMCIRCLCFYVCVGQSMLTVGMLSPSGNPAGDISVKKLRATSYTVSYTAQEKGDHSLVIRWGADDIPGSPFTIPVS